MDLKSKINAFSISFAVIIIISNIAVHYKINDWLTYGAIIYPFTFLLTDVVGEKYPINISRIVVKRGIIISIIPTILLADFRIAIASIVTFLISQNIDIHLFHNLKKKYPSLWWIRNNISTLVSQLFDTALFFILAFSFILPTNTILQLIVGDYMIKFVLALMDTPIFYFFTKKQIKLLLKK